MDKLKIKNKIIIFFVVIYTVYLSVVLVYTYANNKNILEGALKDRITQTYYQLSGNISENIKTENTYEIYQKIHSASVNKEVAYIVIYDNEKNILGKTLKGVPEKLLTFNLNCFFVAAAFLIAFSVFAAAFSEATVALPAFLMAAFTHI